MLRSSADSARNFPGAAAQQVPGDVLQMKLDLLTDLSLVTARGAIDLANVHVLAEALDQLDTTLPLLLDFTGVQYLDSAAIRMLYLTCDHYDRWHTPIALVVSGLVRRVCLRLGLQQRLSLFADLTMARAHLAFGRRLAATAKSAE